MAKTRIYELAKELDVESRQIMAWLQERGQFVRTASSLLDDRVAQMVRDAFHASSPPPIPFLTPSSKTNEEMLSAAESLFGVKPGQLKKRRVRRPPSSRSPSPVARPAHRLSTRSKNGTKTDTAEHEWRRRFFTPEQEAAWRDAGLGEFDAPTAEQCIAAGLRPADLAMKVDGIAVGRRLRDGESVWSVVARMRELGLID